MKRVQAQIKRNLPDMQIVARVERFLVLGLTAALTCLWTLGERAGDQTQLADTSMQVPLVGGTPVILGIIAIIVVNAWFVASETAIDLLKSVHVRQAKDAHAERSHQLQALIDARQKYVAACTLGSQTARLALALISFLLAPSLAQLMDKQYGFQTLLLAAVLIAVPVALVNVVVGEVVPKSFAALHPHRVAIASYRFIRLTSFLFSIPANVVVGLAGVFTARFGGKASLANTNQAEEEIKNLVESAEETGEIEKDEKELLHSVFSFTDKVAREAMTPRVDMDSVPIETPPEELVRLIHESGHSRIPLYEGTDDQILGIVHAKDLLMAMVETDEPVDVRKLMREALFVPENKDLHELLKEMRQKRIQMAVVQDEFGGTAGIVTVEDIVEELVGDIADEYDDESNEIEKAGDSFLVPGKTHLDDVNQEVGSQFSSEEFDTIGGFVFGLFGRQAKAGESMVSDGWRFTIVDSDGRRFLRIKLDKCEHEPDSDAEDS